MRKNNKQSKRKRRLTNPDIISVTSAIELDEKIIAKIKRIFGDKQIKLSIDESITGGIVIQAGDKRFDGSISHQLHKLSQFIKA